MGAMTHLSLWIASATLVLIAAAVGARWGRPDARTRYRILVTTLFTVPTLALVQAVGTVTPLAPESNLSSGTRDLVAAVVPVTHPRDDAAPPISDRGGPVTTPAPRPPVPMPAAPRSPAAIIPWVLGSGALITALIRIRRGLRLYDLVRRGAPVDDAQIREVWERVAADSRLAGRVRLLWHDELRSPACWGLRFPVVLLPRHHPPEPDALAWALRHELVHLERRDALVCAVQAVLTCGLWFHPGIWWLHRALDQSRETSCDQEVVRRTGDAGGYAHALLAFAALTVQTPARPAPLPWFRSRPLLERRIKMLVNLRSARPTTARPALFVAIVALCGLGQWTVASSLSSPAPQEAPSATATKIIEVTLLDPKAATPGTLPILFEGRRPRDLGELRSWLREAADPAKHPARASRPVATDAGDNPVYPSAVALRIFSEARVPYGRIAEITRIAGFDLRNGVARETRESPLIADIRVKIAAERPERARRRIASNPTEAPTVPFKGTVLQVSHSSGMVSFSTQRGRARVGDSLDIIRGNVYLGRVRITSITGNFALGQTMTIASNHRLMPGDTVVGRLR